jgi:hypothetical protein
MRKIILCLVLMIAVNVNAQWVTDKALNNEVIVAAGTKIVPVICSDGANGTIIAWYDDTDGNTLYDIKVQKLNANGVKQWTSPGVSLQFNTVNTGEISIVPDGTGGAVMAFGGNGDIYVQRVDQNGNPVWNGGLPLQICNALNSQIDPVVVNAGDGNFIFTWTDFRNNASVSDLYAQKVSLAGSIGWQANGVIVNLAAEDQDLPQAIPDGAGGVFVCWRDFRSGSNFDIYAQRLNSSGVRQWTGLDGLLSGRLICNASGNQNLPLMVSDGSGGIIISWQDFRNGNVNSTDIYTQRVNATGVVQWTANGVQLCNTVSEEIIESFVFTGDGAVVSWVGFPLGGTAADYNLFAQKVDLSGNPVWAANGVSVCSLNGRQNNSRLAADGSNSAIIVWTDAREGTFLARIYAQRLNGATGAGLWATNGVIASTRFESQGSPQILTNSCNSVITWVNSIPSFQGITSYDIYATAFDCNGSIPGSQTTSTITCPANQVIQAPANSCVATVNNIDPIIGPNPESYSYSLSGATTGSGQGTASGQVFNAGVTTVNYSLINFPGINCSFTVTVNASVTPSVSIVASANNVCAGTNVTFTASPVNGGAASYQWKLNGNNAGTNSSTYSNNSLVTGDAVSVVMTSGLTCANPATATSNTINMVIISSVTPSISIAVRSNIVSIQLPLVRWSSSIHRRSSKCYIGTRTDIGR